MARPKSRLNEIIDGEIARLFEEAGSADAEAIYSLLRKDHDSVVQAEIEDDARRGLMRRIEGRLKHYSDDEETGDTKQQALFPGFPEQLRERIGRVITVPIEGGACRYLDIGSRNTTVAHVHQHVDLLVDHRDGVDSKIAAFREALRRCGNAPADTPFIEALRAP